MRVFPLFLQLEFPINYLAKKLPSNLPQSILLSLYQSILSFNLNQRKLLLSMCKPFDHGPIADLSSTVSREIFLIETRIDQMSRLK